MSETTFENTVPAAVRRQAQQAEEAMRRANEEAVTASADGVPQPAPAGTPVAERPAEAAPAATTEVPPTENWEHKFRTLQGKYNSETARLAGESRAQQIQINNLMQQMLDRAPQAAPPAPLAREDSFQIDPKDIEDYGEDLIKATRRWTAANNRGADPDEVRQLREEVKRLQAQTKEATDQQVQTFMANGLDATAPGWRDTNNDPKFLEWLAQTDPFSGQTRQDMLTQAHQRGDVSRTAAFFTAFQAEHTAVQAPAAPAHTPNGAGQVPLTSLAAPGRGRSASPGAPSDKRSWTQQQIAAFYSDIAKGKWAHDEPGKVRIETDIFTAMAEGRVQ